MTTLQILTAARELLSDEARWTKKVFARSRSRRVLDAASSDAVCWCSLGAICRISLGDDVLRLGAEEILRSTVKMPIGQFNDDPATTHADVLDAFDRAIEKARADG
jgi:hypothetical protein